MPSHTIQKGECLSKIAKSTGFSVDAIWNHANNKALRDKRKSPNVLAAGDVVFIPEIEKKEVKVQTNATHQFKVQTKPPELRLCLLAGGKPVKDVEYTLAIDGTAIEPKKVKKTDAKGMVIAPIAAASQAATVTVAKQLTTYEVKLGHLDPMSEVTGLKARLQQLGYYLGAIDEKPSAMLDVALWLFQNNHNLTTTGAADAATIAALAKAYGI